jgi:hypothetical protein
MIESPELMRAVAWNPNWFYALSPLPKGPNSMLVIMQQKFSSRSKIGVKTSQRVALED